jgi:predicted RNase H-like nuclease
VYVPNPREALMELTPNRLLQGDLALGGLLHDHDALDALAAAYTAWLAANRPDEVSAVGDPAEGVIVVPVAELKDKYTHPSSESSLNL